MIKIILRQPNLRKFSAAFLRCKSQATQSEYSVNIIVFVTTFTYHEYSEFPSNRGVDLKLQILNTQLPSTIVAIVTHVMYNEYSENQICT